MVYRTMFTTLAVVALTSASVLADAKDDLKAAVAKTAGAPNYSWSTKTEGGFGAGTTTGKTEKDGYTQVTLAMRNASVEVFIKDKKAAIKTDDGWKTADELTADQDGGFTPQRMAAMQAQNYKTPLAQAQDVSDKVTDVKAETDGFSGALPEAAAKELMSFRRRPNADANAPAPEIKDAKVTFRVWTKDGVITKLQNHMTGSISFNGNDRDIDRTTTTELSDVGTTKVEVPDDVKKKLEAAPATQPTNP
jgi:hypothetical protein